MGIVTGLSASPARRVCDADRAQVELSAPFRGVALYCFMLPEYLAVTRAPWDIAGAAELTPGASREGHDLLFRLFPDAASIRGDISGASFAQPNVEVLLALNPSGVIHWREFGETKAFLECAGIPVVSLAHARREEWIADAARIFAEVSGNPERGREVAARYRQSVADLARLLPSGRPTVARLWMPPEGGCNAVGKGQLFGVLIERAGGKVAVDAPSAWVDLDIERLLALDPDVILLSSRPGQPRPEALFSRREWQPLKAVKCRRVYSEPPAFSNLMAAPLYCRWLAELLHPDQMEPRLRTMFEAYFCDDFHYAMSDVETDARLLIRENSGSSGYERFGKK